MIFLPPQVIFGGKTDRCHPNYDFPADWDITHSENHWANTETQIQYVENVIMPYFKRKRKELNLPRNAKALCIFDVFRAQMTEDFRDLLKKNHIKFVYVPRCCTDRLQPMDLSVQKSVKENMKASFSTWYADQITKQMSGNTDCEICPVQMQLATMKELFSAWLFKVYQMLCNKPEIIRNGFKDAGITEALCEYLPLKHIQ